MRARIRGGWSGPGARGSGGAEEEPILAVRAAPVVEPDPAAVTPLGRRGCRPVSEAEAVVRVARMTAKRRSPAERRAAAEALARGLGGAALEGAERAPRGGQAAHPAARVGDRGVVPGRLVVRADRRRARLLAGGLGAQGRPAPHGAALHRARAPAPA